MTEANKQNATIVSEAGSSAETHSSENDSEEKIRALVAEHEAKMDEMAELVARIRHDINNPLAGVLGQAQLLLREELNDKARKRAQTIEELAMRLRDIVGELRLVQKPLGSSGHSETGPA